MNWASKPSAIRRASVVLPTPGGPRRSWSAAGPIRRPRAAACPAQQVRLPDHVGQRARTQALGQGHVRPMGRIGREEIVAHWQQMGNKARVSRQHYTTAGYRPPPNESPCPGTPNLQRDRASPSRRPSSCGIHCFPGTDGGPWRVRPHLLKSRNQPFDFNGRFCQASGSLKRLRCAGVSTFGSSKAAANAARSPRYQPSSSWQTRRTIVSGRPPWAHNACKLRFTATQSAPSLSRRTTKWSPECARQPAFAQCSDPGRSCLHAVCIKLLTIHPSRE